MDPDLLLIFGFILVVLAIVFPFAYAINKREHDHKERKLELQARAEEAKAQQARFQNGDYSRMEERVRVLERIATEGNSLDAAETKRISAEIEALRDKQAD